MFACVFSNTDTVSWLVQLKVIPTDDLWLHWFSCFQPASVTPHPAPLQIDYLWRPVSWEPRALSKHKDTLISSHTPRHARTHRPRPPPPHPIPTHTDTHYKFMHYWWWTGKKKKPTDGEEKRRVFSFDLKEESEGSFKSERGREFQSTSPKYWKDPSPRRPVLGTRKLRVSAAEREGE